MTASSDAVREEIVFRGHVQGVGFRATTRAIASRFAVCGWVRNESNGSVKCVVEGSVEEVDRFVLAVQQEKAGNIDTLDRRRIDRAKPLSPEFEIRF